jgi:hypothetical protein
MITSRHANLHQSNDYPAFVSQLRAHGLSLDRGQLIKRISAWQSEAVIGTEICYILGRERQQFDKGVLLVPVLDEAEFFNLRVPKYLFSCCNRCLSPAVR